MTGCATCVDSTGNVFVVTGNGNYTQTAGTFRLAGGTVTSSTALNFTGGLVDARGTINAAITHSPNLQPALSGNGLVVNGAVSLLNASKLTFQLGGLSQGRQYGFLNVNGTVALNGNLVVSFVNSFQAGTNDNFTVLSSTAPLIGSFVNVPSGSRVGTTDGSGTFLVTYSGNTIVLSNFQVSGARPSAPAQDAIPAMPTLAARSSDESQSIHTPGRVGRTRMGTPHAGIALQYTDQLRTLMENIPATRAGTGGSVVVVHPQPGKPVISKGAKPLPAAAVKTPDHRLLPGKLGPTREN